MTRLAPSASSSDKGAVPRRGEDVAEDMAEDVVEVEGTTRPSLCVLSSCLLCWLVLAVSVWEARISR